MNKLIFKDGREFNIEQMKDFLVADDTFGGFNSLDEISKDFKFSKRFIVEKIQKTFGDKGILLLFFSNYDVKNNDYGIEDTEKFLDDMRITVVNIPLKRKIRHSLIRLYFNLKYLLKDIFNFFTIPIREILHRKKYYVSRHISYWFDSYFLKIIHKNLKYYEKITSKRYVIEGWLKENLKRVQKVKDFCVSYQLLYGINDEILTNFEFLDHDEYITKESKELILKSLEEIKEDFKDYSIFLVNTVLESGI